MLLPSANALPTFPSKWRSAAGADHVRDLVAVHEDGSVGSRELLELVERGPRSLLVGDVRERLLVAAILGRRALAILEFRAVGLEARRDPRRRPRRRRDEVGDVADLPVAQLAAERGHPDPAVLHLAGDAVGRGPELVEVRSDRAFRARPLKRVAAAAARAGEDLGAGAARGGHGRSGRLLTSATACGDENEAAGERNPPSSAQNLHAPH